MKIFPSVERYLPPDQLASWALVAAVCGLLAEIRFLPEAPRALLLLAFVLVGPGSVVLDWMGALPRVAVRALVPMTGLSIVLLAVSGGLLLGFWSSRLTLLILVVLTAVGATFNRRRDPEPNLLEPNLLEPGPVGSESSESGVGPAGPAAADTPDPAAAARTAAI